MFFWQIGNWIQRLAYKLWVTNYRAFFAVNGVGEILDKKFRGFKENQNSFDVCAQWTAMITGKLRGPDGYGFYYAAVTIDGLEWARYGNKERFVEEKKANGERMLESFAKPECRCRVGFHWKCAVHNKWEG